MPDPLFDPSERVDPDALPPELQGKSPAEIARFFMERENRLTQIAVNKINEAKRTPAPAPATTEPPKGTVTITTPDNIPFDKLPAALQQTAIDGARQMALAGKPYLDKYVGEIDGIMAQMRPEQKADKDTWVTVYNSVIGSHQEDITKAAIAKATSITTESSNPPDTPTAPTPISSEARKVVTGFGLNDDKYREAQKRIEEGVWPLTMESK